MTEQDRPNREDDGYIARRGFGNRSAGYDRNAGSGRRSDEGHGRERDFGDSAGYGTGGSALDYHEVGDEDASPIKGKHNPLDDVMKPELRSDPDEG